MDALYVLTRKGGWARARNEQGGATGSRTDETRRDFVREVRARGRDCAIALCLVFVRIDDETRVGFVFFLSLFSTRARATARLSPKRTEMRIFFPQLIEDEKSTRRPDATGYTCQY
jgi:hypothetical protein